MRELLKFDHFVGKVGLLSGVWTSQEQVRKPYYEGDTEIAAVLYFMWQGEIYVAAENPDDGYRSSLGYIERIPNLFPVNVWNPSERCRVRFVGERESYPGEQWSHKEKTDLIEFVSEVTDKVVLTLGTTNTDDYYPGCVMSFDPLALSHNQTEVDLLGRGLNN